MLVYGDQQHVLPTSGILDRVRSEAAGLVVAPPGICWHQSCVAMFVTVAGLLQGVADAEFMIGGWDDPLPAQSRLMTLLRALADTIDRSWSSGFATQIVPDLSALDGLVRDIPAAVTIRRCEGYAFYALYPELYLAAARHIPAGACVIGMRSIGTGLAAAVASASNADFWCTLRPIGPAYARHIAVGPALEAEFVARRDGIFALVDEGPGRSGSSFGGVADYLEDHGVARERILFLPSHSGDLGPDAIQSHRRRWQQATRLTCPIDDILLGAAPTGLASWFGDATGAPIAPLRDVSGGEWRTVSPCPDAPVDPGRERRKFLLTTASGTFLLKFAGLDAIAHDGFAVAKLLYEAGFTPEPVAIRHGFLAERWMATATAPDVAAIWSRVAPYLAFRAASFPVVAGGASLPDLVAMARYNIRQAFGPLADDLFADWPDARVAALAPLVRPVWIDGRMQRWEWIRTASGVLKTDAIDHAHGHDLVGCQDIAWDVAGAIVELDATQDQGADLIRSVMPGRAGAADLTALMIVCYLGFQIGWWHFATDAGSAEGRRAFYRARIAALTAI